jgi:hypothetical protein
MKKAQKRKTVTRKYFELKPIIPNSYAVFDRNRSWKYKIMKTPGR